MLETIEYKNIDESPLLQSQMGNNPFLFHYFKDMNCVKDICKCKMYTTIKKFELYIILANYNVNFRR